MEAGLFILLILLVILSAFFSGSEIAFASVNKTKLKKKSESGNTKANIALYIYEHFEDALSTILIGNNLVNIGASSVATVIAISFWGESGVAASTFIITIIILIFGEITPKTIAKKQSNKFTLLVSYPLKCLMIILKPIISVIVWFVKQVSKLWGKEEKEPFVTEEELVTIIENVTDDGVIDEERSELLQSALTFSDITVHEILTHRTDMVVINIDDDKNTIIKTLLNSPYSLIPVYKDNIDNIIGILNVGHFLRQHVDSDSFDIHSSLSKVFFIHKTIKLADIFSELKSRQLQMAIVTDEHGGTMGCVTMEDVLEELVGNIWDESDEIVHDFIPVAENTYEVSGDLSTHDFFKYLDIDDRNFESDYKTVGGWAIEIFDGMPNLHDSFNYKNLTVTVTMLNNLRVTKLSVFVKPVAQEKTNLNEKDYLMEYDAK